MINKKCTKFAVVFLTMVLLASIFLSMSYAIKIISTEGEFQTDGVDVSISATADDSEVNPGKNVRYEPVISYKGVDSYIRFTLDITDEDITLDSFKGLNDDWVRQGDYFYYKKIVHHQEEIPTFTSFHVPRDWKKPDMEAFMGSKFRVTALCDAVQAKNFTPNFESKNPWGELEIEENAYDGNNFVNKENTAYEPITLSFLGSGQYSISSDKMVNSAIQPGDTYTNEIHLLNNSKNDTEVFFYVSEQENEDKNNLLDALSLTIRLDGEIYYEGTLRAVELLQQKSLVYMKPGEEHILSYEIHMPAELKNAYEEKIDDFVWNFMATDHPGYQAAPATGDESKFMFFVILAGISLVLLLILLQKKKGTDEQHE